MRDELELYRESGVTPLGVNPAKPASHEAWSAKMKFGFTLLSDSERAVAGAWNALKEDGRGIQRTVYVIGADGRIRFAERGIPAGEAIRGSLA